MSFNRLQPNTLTEPLPVILLLDQRKVLTIAEERLQSWKCALET